MGEIVEDTLVVEVCRDIRLVGSVGADQQGMGADGLGGLDIATAGTDDSNLSQVDTESLGDLAEHACSRFAAFATLAGGVRAVGDDVHMAANAVELLMEFVVDGVERIQIEQAGGQAGLIGGHGNPVTGLSQPRYGLQTAGDGGPVVGTGDGMAVIMVDDAVTPQDDQLAQVGFRLGIRESEGYRKLGVLTSSLSVHVPKFRHPDASTHHARLALHQLVHLVPEGLAQIEIGGDTGTHQEDEQVCDFFSK